MTYLSCICMHAIKTSFESHKWGCVEEKGVFSCIENIFFLFYCPQNM